jgi:hypothetical protein
MPVAFTANSYFLLSIVKKFRSYLDYLFHNQPLFGVIHLTNSSEMRYKNGNTYVSIKTA